MYSDNPGRDTQETAGASLKFTGPIGRLIVRATNALMEKWPKEKIARPIHELTPLGGVEGDIVREVGVVRAQRELVPTIPVEAYADLGGADLRRIAP